MANLEDTFSAIDAWIGTMLLPATPTQKSAWISQLKMGSASWNSWIAANPPRQIDFTDVDFQEVSLGSAFDDFVFPVPTFFDGATFPAGISFKATRFNKLCSFSNTKFLGRATFEDSVFDDDAVFQATELDHCTFDRARFSGTLRLTDVQLIGNNSFAAVEASAVSLVNCIFGSSSLAHAAHLLKGRTPSGAWPEQTAHAVSQHHTTFAAATIGKIKLTAVVFNGTGDFRRCRFSKFAEFDGTKFHFPADFSAAVFEDGASFNGALFGHMLQCIDTAFGGPVTFVRTNFYGMTTFNAYSAEGQFREVDFTDAQFHGPVYFHNRVFEGTTRFTAAFFAVPPAFHNAKMHQDTDFLRAVFARNEHEDAERNFRTLKLHMAGMHAQWEEREFFAREMQARRLRETDKLAALTISAYDLLSDYGGSLKRPLVALSALLLSAFLVNFVLIYAGSFVCVTTSSCSAEPMSSHISLVARYTLAQSIPIIPGIQEDLRQHLVALRLSEWRHLILNIVGALQFLATVVLVFLLGLAVRNLLKVKTS